MKKIAQAIIVATGLAAASTGERLGLEPHAVGSFCFGGDGKTRFASCSACGPSDIVAAAEIQFIGTSADA